MAGDETGIFERAPLGEFPEDRTRCEWRQPQRIGVSVLHVGKFLHQFGMLSIGFFGRQHEFMTPGSFIEDLKTNLFAEPDLHHRRLEQHLLAVLENRYFHGAKRLCGIAGLARGEVLMRAMGEGYSEKWRKREASCAEERT